MTEAIYAVGDIHGQLEELERVLSLIEADGGADAHVVFLGDYVDRGANSKGVLQRLIEGVEAGRNWTCLKGNHDRMFEWFMEETPRHDPHLLVGHHWLHERLGGVETLASYGIEVPAQIRLHELHSIACERIPEKHVVFLKGLQRFHLVDDILFVHAGLCPGVALEVQTEDDLVWIREPFLSYKKPHPWLVIHGHTALKHPTDFGNRIDLDGGAAYGRPLSAAVIEGGKAKLLTEAGRVDIARPAEANG